MPDRATLEHLSIFPFSRAAIEAVRARLDGFDLAKGTIRFSPDRPVPADVLADPRPTKVALETHGLDGPRRRLGPPGGCLPGSPEAALARLWFLV